MRYCLNCFLIHIECVYFVIGSSISVTASERFSALISEMQQNFPSFFRLTTASLSPALIFAFSLTSFGSTICPLPSIVITDSTLQHFSLLFLQVNLYSFLINQKI